MTLARFARYYAVAEVQLRQPTPSRRAASIAILLACIAPAPAWAQTVEPPPPPPPALACEGRLVQAVARLTDELTRCRRQAVNRALAPRPKPFNEARCKAKARRGYKLAVRLGRTDCPRGPRLAAAGLGDRVAAFADQASSAVYCQPTPAPTQVSCENRLAALATTPKTVTVTSAAGATTTTTLAPFLQALVACRRTAAASAARKAASDEPGCVGAARSTFDAAAAELEGCPDCNTTGASPRTALEIGMQLVFRDLYPCGPRFSCDGEPCQDPSTGCPDGEPCTMSWCDDDDPCTTDSCDGASCQHANAPEDTACGTDLCLASACKSGHCVAANKPDGTSCSDGDMCNGDETCTRGLCIRGTPLSCGEDGNQCTDASCQPDKGCVQTPNHKECYDGSLCTLNRCQDDGTCKAVEFKDCSDQCPCTIDECDSATGDCSHTLRSPLPPECMPLPAGCPSG